LVGSDLLVCKLEALLSPQVAVACNHKHFLPQVAIVKMGLSVSRLKPHFHKSTWAQSTYVFRLAAELCALGVSIFWR
jgi:hypothetical protein